MIEAPIVLIIMLFAFCTGLAAGVIIICLCMAKDTGGMVMKQWKVGMLGVFECLITVEWEEGEHKYCSGLFKDGTVFDSMESVKVSEKGTVNSIDTWIGED